MAYTGNDATDRWKLTSEQEAHIAEITNGTELAAYIRQCGLDNNVIQHLQGASPDILVDVPQGAQPATEKITIDGITYEGTAAQLNEVARKMAALKQDGDQPARDENGRFVATADADQNGAKASEASALRAAELANLELRFKRGDIATADYLAQSGAMDEYLASKGFDVASVQAEAQSNRQAINDWASATRQFLANHPDWVGGEQLKNAMGAKVSELGLEDHPSAESLERCYSALAIEAEMSTTTDPYRLAELKEQYRMEVQGRTSTPNYRR